MSKKTEERRNKIYQFVLNNKKVTVNELSENLDVSIETIRKDLIVMDEQGLIRKNHGYACSIDTYEELPLNIKIGENASLKQRIALEALNLIEDNSVVYLDPGSTVLALTHYLPLKKNLTIVTSSFAVAQIISESKHDLIFLGGKLQKKGNCTVGSFAIENMEAINIDIAFLGSDGIMNNTGPTTFSWEEMNVKKMVLKKADVKVLLLDSTKFHLQGHYMYTHFDEFNYLITDDLPIVDKFRLKNVRQFIIAK